MVLPGFFDGIKTYTSSKGKAYADIFIHGMDGDGNPDVEQLKIRTFSESVIAAAKLLKKEDVVNVELTIKDAIVENIGK